MSIPVQPRYIPIPFQEAPEAGRVLLRDGTTAQLRRTQPEDFEAVKDFFACLSPEARRRRFFSLALPSAELLRSFCDNTNPAHKLTLAVTRIEKGNPLIIAIGSYQAQNEKTVEMAFAVDDAFHGKGLGTLLLERLALLAVRHGFTRCWAMTHAENREMREVFRNSGFDIQEKREGSEIEVDLSLMPTEKSVTLSEMRDRVATIVSLRPFFRPNAVAVVGASRNPASIGYRTLEALVQNRFQGPVYAVNPRADVVGCFRAYPSVRDLPEPVDLAVIVVPSNVVLDVVDDCAARGVRALAVISAGFAEIKGGGIDLQQQLLDKVRGHGMRMVGPNCLGLLNTDPAVQLNASFSPIFPPAGRIAMSSQSGALGLAILAAAKRLHLGLSSFVSVGNKADVSGNDLLQYWEEDEQTDLILLYLESFGNPRRFARIARRVSQKKPIVAIKSGRTRAGGRAAGSHTAALAASEVAVEALFAQSGVIRAETLEEMFDLAAALANQPLPRGRRVGIVTNAGGPAILCADACEASGLQIPEFTPTLQAQLARFLPLAASTGNPIDMIASAGPEQYRQVLGALLASDEVDALIIIYIPPQLNGKEGIVRALQQAVSSARQDKTILACLMTPEGEAQPIEVDNRKIPAYAFPEAVARVLGKIADHADWRQKPAGIIPDFEGTDVAAARSICQRALEQRGAGWLSAGEARSVLAAMGLPILPGDVARTAEDAAELAARLGFPVAVKLASTKLVHKTEVGGVHLNLSDANAVRQAFAAIHDHLAQTEQLDALEGVLVQPMQTAGIEVMVGVTQDPLFGPLIAFGLGGIHVEILADVCFRITPLTDRDAREMVQTIRGYKLLQGYRGHPPADIPALEELLLRISRLVEEVPEIQQIDLNPIFALRPGDGCRIADARIRIEEK